MSKELKDMTLIEKKAVVYDLLAQQQNIQQQIQIVNQAIQEDLKKLPEPKTE